MKIFVITHKRIDNLPKLGGEYLPLLVGAKSKPKLKNEYLCDDTGINISNKNNSYCELTGLYWIWKNCDDDIVGLVHYRRFFCNFSFWLRTPSCYIVKKKEYSIFSENQFSTLLNRYDVLVYKTAYSRSNNLTSFQNGTTIGNQGWRFLENVFSTRTEIEQYYFKKYSSKHTHIRCNMFVGKKPIIDSYCKWLFQILQEIDDFYLLETGEYAHNREMGYFAELLFGVWLDVKGIKYKSLSVLNIESPSYYTLKEYIDIKLKH